MVCNTIRDSSNLSVHLPSSYPRSIADRIKASDAFGAGSIPAGDTENKKHAPRVIGPAGRVRHMFVPRDSQAVSPSCSPRPAFALHLSTHSVRMASSFSDIAAFAASFACATHPFMISTVI